MWENNCMKQVHILTITVTLVALMAASAAEAVSNAAVLYLRVAAGARPAGMGEAFVSIADDATATYWNPAGLGNAPIAGKLEKKELPADYGEIMDAVTVEGPKGDPETWVIAGGELLMFDGKTWNSGKEYITSSDQTLYDFVQTIFNTDDQRQLRAMADKVVAENCPVTGDDIDAFIESVRAFVPGDYADMDDLQRGLDTLKSGYRICLLNAQRFRDLQRKLADGLKDSVLTAEETDRLTYSMDGTILRFLPGRLRVPYSAGIDASMFCLGSSGRYLWVGTDNGAYRRSGMAWARYSIDDGLPSDTIYSMDNNGERLLIGTARGAVLYYQGGFTPYPGLPASPVTAIAFDSPNHAYAAVGNIIYYLEGEKWSEGFSYTVRIDDDLDKIIDRISIYHTPSEYDYLKNRIIELNKDNVPQLTQTGEATAGETPVAGEGEAESDSTEAPADESPAVEDTAVVDVMEESETGSGVYPWLVEGNSIQLPYSPRFPFDVTALHFGLYNNLWVGTTAGLLSFAGQVWTTYGYTRFIVPSADSAAGDGSMTAEDISRKFLRTTDSSKIALLAGNIDVYNELNGQSVAPGDTVYVYSGNIGSAISGIGTVFGELIVGTEFDVVRKTSSGWEPAQIGEYRRSPSQHPQLMRWDKAPHAIRRQTLVAAYDYAGEAYYVSTRILSIETRGRSELVGMFAKWLPDLDVDMYYLFLSFVHHARGFGTFGGSIVYLTYGSIQFTDATGAPIGEENPYEVTFAGSYGTSLSSNLKLGGTIKVIHSHLSSIGAGEEEGEGIAWAFAVDAGMLYKLTGRLQFGAALTNVGPDIKYVDAAQADPLPRNLALGLSYKLWDTPYNRLIIQGELNKMLVSLNQGLNQELEYAIRHVGAEYWYADLIALRAGYKYDKEGEVKHLTFGAGIQIEPLRFDMAYIPSSIDSPLANTLRISISGMF